MFTDERVPAVQERGASVREDRGARDVPEGGSRGVVRAEYARDDAGGRFGMMSQAQAMRREVAEWLDGMFETKRFGRFSVEITKHDGVPVGVEKSDCVTYANRKGEAEKRG